MWNCWSLLQRIFCWNVTEEKKLKDFFGRPNQYTGLPNGLNMSLMFNLYLFFVSKINSKILLKNISSLVKTCESQKCRFHHKEIPNSSFYSLMLDLLFVCLFSPYIMTTYTHMSYRVKNNRISTSYLCEVNFNWSVSTLASEVIPATPHMLCLKQ